MSLALIVRCFLLCSPLTRRLLLIVTDALLLPLAVWLSFWLRLATPWPLAFLKAGLWMALGVVVIGLPLYAFSGQYKGLTRYVGSTALYRLAARNGLLVLFLAASGVLFSLPMPPRSSWLLLWLLLTGFTGAVRFVLRDLLLSFKVDQTLQLSRVLIYGAGDAGAQLAAALRLARSHQIFGFLDDDPRLWGRTLNGIPVFPPERLSELALSVDQVLLAMPSQSRSKRRQLVDRIQRVGVSVLQVPSVDDITSGRARIDALRPIAIEDLLGRDSVEPLPELLGPGIRDCVVCVTGAGGSIGGELCRQILALQPRQLLLLERSEPALYSIEQELRRVLLPRVELTPVLGDAGDVHLLRSLFASVNIDVVFHAAAYKHVPLVEANPLAGLENNVFVTRALCQEAQAAGVAELVLISTDKAVRPTNVMGASKRLAELVVQASAQQTTCTRFAMVRFGNVLGSSGSVVPLFRQQIMAGGPITLTHPDIIRYFMTIPEAAQLVLQAAVLAKGGDVFLLDMGEPVRIKDLAGQMIRLSGLSIRDQSQPSGDIEIRCTGLRPGEKLYEELLIDAESHPTDHPLIFRAQERSLLLHELLPQLDALDSAVAAQDAEAALKVLAELVPEWQRTAAN